MKKKPQESPKARVCAYPKCNRGLGLKRSRFIPVREHQRYCSDACRYLSFIEKKRGGGDPDLVSRIRKIEEKLGI